MSYFAYTIRIIVFYILGLIMLTGIYHFFELPRNNGLNIGVLFAIAYYCIYAFYKKNPDEIPANVKWPLILYGWLATLFVQLLFFVPFLITLGPELLMEFPMDFLLFFVPLFTLSYFLVFLFSHYLARTHALK